MVHMVRMVHAVKNAVHVVVNASGEFDGCECDIQFCDECYVVGPTNNIAPFLLTQRGGGDSLLCLGESFTLLRFEAQRRSATSCTSGRTDG